MLLDAPNLVVELPFFCNRIRDNADSQGKEIWTGCIYSQCFLLNVLGQTDSASKLREWLSTHPIEVLYYLETPIEYNLTDEEVQTFMALHAYKPTTYITNDAELPVGMEANYVTDLQTYIDNKIAALSSSGEE